MFLVQTKLKSSIEVLDRESSVYEQLIYSLTYFIRTSFVRDSTTVYRCKVDRRDHCDSMSGFYEDTKQKNNNNKSYPVFVLYKKRNRQEVEKTGEKWKIKDPGNLFLSSNLLLPYKNKYLRRPREILYLRETHRSQVYDRKNTSHTHVETLSLQRRLRGRRDDE